MALQSLNNYVSLPSIGLIVPGGTFSTTVLDAADEKLAWVFLAPKTGLIRKIGFRTGTVTTGATVDVRLEGVTMSTGEPSGVLAGTTTNASQVIASADDNVWFTTQLTSDASVTAGQALAIVIVNPSGGFMQIASGFGATYTNQFPYSVAYLSGAWGAKGNGSLLSFYIEYHDGTTCSIGNAPLQSHGSVTFNTGSAADERALYFSVPFPCKVAGADIMVPSWAGNGDIYLYDSDGTTVLSQVTGIDKDLSRAGTVGLLRVIFDTPATIAANTNYRLALKPTSGSNVGWYEYTFSSTTYMAAVDGGTAFHLSTQADASGWSQTTTTRPSVALLISALDDGATGGVIVRSHSRIGL